MCKTERVESLCDDGLSLHVNRQLQEGKNGQEKYQGTKVAAEFHVTEDLINILK